MRRLHAGANFTVFVLFFGLALIEALQSGNWLLGLFWLGVAFLFLLGDSPRRLHGRRPKGPG